MTSLPGWTFRQLATHLRPRQRNPRPAGTAYPLAPAHAVVRSPVAATAAWIWSITDAGLRPAHRQCRTIVTDRRVKAGKMSAVNPDPGSSQAPRSVPPVFTTVASKEKCFPSGHGAEKDTLLAGVPRKRPTQLRGVRGRWPRLLSVARIVAAYPSNFAPASTQTTATASRNTRPNRRPRLLRGSRTCASTSKGRGPPHHMRRGSLSRARPCQITYPMLPSGRLPLPPL